MDPIGHRAVDRSFRLHWLENDGILAKLWINPSIEQPWSEPLLLSTLIIRRMLVLILDDMYSYVEIANFLRA